MNEMLSNNLLACHAAAATASIAVTACLTYPLDTLKTLVQVGSSSSKQLTSFQVLSRVLSLSGYSGLYIGLGWLIPGRILGVGMRFGVYEILTAFYKDGREDNYVYISEALMAGMAAGSVESLVSSPLELIKLRQQVGFASLVPRSIAMTENKGVVPVIDKLLRGYVPVEKALNQSVALISTLTTKRSDLAAALKEYPWMISGSGKPPSVCDVSKPSKVVSLEGWGALWKGFRSGIARDSVFSGVFFSSWQFMHQAMLDWKAAGMNPPPRSDGEIGPLSPLSVSFAAGFSGIAAVAASHCFDTAKSRAQCTVLPKYISMERKFMKWRRPGNWFERNTGIHPSDRNVLFRGIGLRMARSGLSSFFVVGSYYLTVNYLVPE